MYIVIVTGKINDGEWVEDAFLEAILDNQELIGFSNVEEYKSDLTHLAISYVLQRQDMLDTLSNKFTYKVFRLTFLAKVLKINPDLDGLFRDCVFSFSEPINSTLFYLIEEDGELDFHKVSNGYFDAERVEDDHLEMRGGIDDPDMFYRHFYGMEYTDEQIAAISKMMLVVGESVAV